MVYFNDLEFEFDSHKSESNRIKHGISFQEAQTLWQNNHVEFRLNTSDEARWLIIGTINQKYWSAIITKRKKRIRIISVRRSRNEEKKIFEEKNKAQSGVD